MDQITRNRAVACLSSMDHVGPGANGQFVAHWDRYGTQDKVSPNGCVQAFSQSDFRWHDRDSIGTLSDDPQCWNFNCAFGRYHPDWNSSAAGGGISDEHTWEHIHSISPQ